jgi:hypothetical protein
MRIQYTTDSPFLGFFSSSSTDLRSCRRGRSESTAAASLADAIFFGLKGAEVRILLDEGLREAAGDNVRLDMVALSNIHHEAKKPAIQNWRI